MMKLLKPLSLPLRIVLLVLLGIAGVMALRAAGGYGRQEDSKVSLAQAREQLQKLSSEREQLTALVNAAESRLTMERAAQAQLAQQIRALESENNRLKEDLAFFESLLPAEHGPAGIAIRRLRADWLAPGQLRYRLLVIQGGKGVQEFAGAVQFVLTVVRAGKSTTLQFPDQKDGEPDKYHLMFKHYQRLEGVLALPEDVSVRAIQVRVLEQGKVRVQQSLNL
jgi:DNA-binding transcriptional MerR regulator